MTNKQKPVEVTDITEIDCGAFIRHNYLVYGKYVNFHRVIPSIDGLKPVQRRILLALNKTAAGKFTPTAAAIADTFKMYHPFSTLSIENVIGDLARVHTLKTIGDFGVKLISDIPAAAPRYTQVGLSTEMNNYLFSLLKYSPMTEGETLMEPEFLISPVPLILISGSFSWGLGLTARYPAFTYESIIKAYYSNDYHKLKSSYGYEIDFDKSDIKSIWELGKGRMTLKMPSCVKVSNDRILIKGSGEIFKPRLTSKKINEWIENGQIKFNNSSSEEISIEVERVKGARKVNMSEVFTHLKDVSCTNSKNYDLRVVHNDKIVRLGMKDWLDITIGLFEEKYEQYKKDRIEKIDYDVVLLTNLPAIGKLVLENKTSEQISKALKLSIEIIKSAESKSVSMLRKTSFDREIEVLAKRKINISKENPTTLTKKTFIKTMEEVSRRTYEDYEN